MAKENKMLKPALGLFTLLTAFIVGGLFIQGSTTGNIVLQYIPSVIHPIVGWIIVAGAAILGVMGTYKLIKKR